MSNLNCPHCHKAISVFSKQLIAPQKYPFCPHCQQAIKVTTNYTLLAIGGVVGALVGALIVEFVGGNSSLTVVGLGLGAYAVADKAHTIQKP